MKKIKIFASLISILNFIFIQSSFAKTDNKTTTQIEIEKAANSMNQIENAYQLWSKIRSNYTLHDKYFLDTWFLAHADDPTPKIQIKKVRQGSGLDGFRLLLSQNETLGSVEIKGDLQEIYQLNKFQYSDSDFKDLKNISNQISESKNVEPFKISTSINQMDTRIYSNMTKDEKIEYFLNKRLVLESAQNVILKNNSTSQNKIRSMNLLNALLHIIEYESLAIEPQNCLLNTGFIGQQKNNTCSAVESSQTDSSKTKNIFKNIKCADGMTLCNPMIYGLDRNNTGQGLCVSNTQIIGTSCSSLSPIQSDSDILAFKKSLENSNVFSSTSSIDPNAITQILKNQNALIKKALQLCESNTGSDTDQCAELKQRQIKFNSMLVDNSEKSDKPKISERNNEISTFTKSTKNVAREDSKSTPATSDTACGILCSMSKWISTPLGIITASTLAGFIGYRAGQITANRKNAAQNAAASAGLLTPTTNTTSPSTPAIGTPSAPTTPIYTGVVQ